MTNSPETIRPPVALGCFFAVAVVAVFAGIVIFGIVFLESGADTGSLELEVDEAYAPGSVEFLGEENVFLVRLESGEFVALSDFDVPNRRSAGARCRVVLTPIEGSSFPVSGQALRAQMSSSAAGAESVFRETCLGGVYDVAGAKLLGPGPNLVRHPVTVNGSGRVVIDVSKRTCSERTERAEFAPTAC